MQALFPIDFLSLAFFVVCPGFAASSSSTKPEERNQKPDSANLSSVLCLIQAAKQIQNNVLNIHAKILLLNRIRNNTNRISPHYRFLESFYERIVGMIIKKAFWWGIHYFIEIFTTQIQLFQTIIQ